MRSLSLQDLWRRRFHRRLAASPWSTREITLCDNAREEHYSRRKEKKIIKAILIYAVAPYLPRASYFFAPVLSRVICPSEQTLLHPSVLNVAADVLFTPIAGTVLMLAWNCICVESFYSCLFVFFLLTSIDVTHVVQMYTHIQLTTHLCSSLCSECVFASIVFTFMVVLCASQMEHISVYLKNECKHLTSKIATRPAVHFFTPERETAHLHSKTMCCSILVCSEPRDSLWAVNIMFSVTSGHSFRSAPAILWTKYTFYPRTVGMFCVRCQSDSF